MITVTFLPPRTSGLLQPADISVFGAMKQAWKNGGQLDLWKLHMEEVGADKARWSTFRDHIPYKDALAFLNNFVETTPAELYKKGWEPLFTGKLKGV